MNPIRKKQSFGTGGERDVNSLAADRKRQPSARSSMTHLEAPEWEKNSGRRWGSGRGKLNHGRARWSKGPQSPRRAADKSTGGWGSPAPWLRRRRMTSSRAIAEPACLEARRWLNLNINRPNFKIIYIWCIYKILNIILAKWMSQINYK